MKNIQTEKGKILIVDDENIIFNDSSSIVELIWSEEADTIAIPAKNLPDSFFDLSTRLAGEILQKLTLYNIRIIILGSFDKFNSKSLNDFIYESNKNGKVIFSQSLDDGVKLLK